MLNKNLGYVHFWLTIICVYAVFFPMHFIGLAGVPRRYYANTAYEGFDQLININELISVFALLAGVAQVIFGINFFYSMFKGKIAPQNPWNSNTTIGFDLPYDADVTFTIFDVTGKTVKTIEGEYKAGYNTIILNVQDLPGTGVMYYRLESGEYSASKKMVLIK